MGAEEVEEVVHDCRWQDARDKLHSVAFVAINGLFAISDMEQSLRVKSKGGRLRLEC